MSVAYAHHDRALGEEHGPDPDAQKCCCFSRKSCCSRNFATAKQKTLAMLANYDPKVVIQTQLISSVPMLFTTAFLM